MRSLARTMEITYPRACTHTRTYNRRGGFYGTAFTVIFIAPKAFPRVSRETILAAFPASDRERRK